MSCVWICNNGGMNFSLKPHWSVCVWAGGLEDIDLRSSGSEAGSLGAFFEHFHCVCFRLVSWRCYSFCSIIDEVPLVSTLFEDVAPQASRGSCLMFVLVVPVFKGNTVRSLPFSLTVPGTFHEKCPATTTTFLKCVLRHKFNVFVVVIAGIVIIIVIILA